MAAWGNRPDGRKFCNGAAHVCDGGDVTTLFLVARLVWRLLALPGRALIRWLDRRKAVNHVPPLGTFLRGCVHGFVWLIALMAFSMATVTPVPTATPATPTPATVRPTPTNSWVEPTLAPTSTAPSTAGDEPVYVPLPDDDDDHDWDKPRVCHRKWWC